MNPLEKYQNIRNYTVEISKPLHTEDFVVQPVANVSPPKWHLGHTTWFFETFVLIPFLKDYKVFDKNYNYVFNSYYETVGARVIRTNRGNLSRPTVEDIFKYRKYVDDAMNHLLLQNQSTRLEEIVVLGLNHEQQHQELLMTDIKYILGNNPLFPPYISTDGKQTNKAKSHSDSKNSFLKFQEGIYEIGFDGEGFCFDNELKKHKVFLTDFRISKSLVSNKEYLEFIKDGGYKKFEYWHSDGWEWVKSNHIEVPLYWYFIEEKWHHYTLEGMQILNTEEPVCHVSYYEAAAYASWKKMRLPTESEWEAASEKIDWGRRWEWTESAYLPYPGFLKAPGAIGEYNGKFMVNQMVLRGASDVTSAGHSRKTYRNFFQPNLRWQYTGIRLAQ